MKLRGFFVLVMVVMIAWNVSAITTNLEDSYNRKETVIVEIEGNILQQIQTSQIKLKKGNSYVAFEYGLKNIDDNNYLWFVTPNIESMYTLILENVHAIENGQAQQITYEKTFSIGNETEDYYVKPGVMIASEDFFVTGVNNKNSNVMISVDEPSSREIILKPGENRIHFDIEEFEGSQTRTINIGKYGLPSKIYGAGVVNTNETEEIINETENDETNVNESNDTINITSNYSFEFGSSVIKTKVSNSSVGQKIKFEIKNTGERDIKGLKFIYAEDYFLLEPLSTSIPMGESVEFSLEILKIPEKDFRDAVIVEIDREQKYFLVLLENAQEVANISVEYVEEEESQSFYYCSELGGKICSIEESCSESEITSLDGQCCLAECSTDGPGGAGSWIGYSVALIIIVIIVFVFMKYRKAKPSGESVVKSKFMTAEKKLP